MVVQCVVELLRRLPKCLSWRGLVGQVTTFEYARASTSPPKLPESLARTGRENTGDAELARVLWNVTESHPR